jgi:hypothetical protein
MTVRPGIFPTFFLSGFECSTFRWKDRGRRDLAAETQHREHAHEDYRMLRSLGIAVARVGVPWPMVESGGRYDIDRSADRGDERSADSPDLGSLPLRLPG